MTINSKNANNKIVDRFPDYGDGHKDGCLVMQEIRLDLKTGKEGQVNGIITDVSTGDRLQNASVLLKNNLNQSLNSKTDTLGQFKAYMSGKLIEIRLDYVGYRSMIVRF